MRFLVMGVRAWRGVREAADFGPWQNSVTPQIAPPAGARTHVPVTALCPSTVSVERPELPNVPFLTWATRIADFSAACSSAAYAPPYETACCQNGVDDEVGGAVLHEAFHDPGGEEHEPCAAQLIDLTIGTSAIMPSIARQTRRSIGLATPSFSLEAQALHA